jgi:hypothetical protein
MNTIWKPYNVRAITNNVKLVFKTGDINKLNGSAYKFIINYHGFIAHYNLGGFRDVYDGHLTGFAKNLLSSEISNNPTYNEMYANSRAAGGYDDQGGKAYQKSIVETMRTIIGYAKIYLKEK